ncbi:MAG: cytochrome c3 family protein [Chloroflexota bacterium]
MKRFLLPAVAAMLLATVVACAGATPPAPTAAKPAASASAPAATPAANQPTAIPNRTIAEIKVSVSTSRFLDGVHYRAGKPCEGCHGSLPATGTPALPTPTKCLPCHGGTYDGLASLTALLGDKNPHNAHTGQLACTQCHNVHRPFELYCNNCHSLSIPDKFKTGTTS